MENSTISKKERVLWGVAIVGTLLSLFSVWQIYILKMEMFVVNTRTERAEKELNLNAQTAINFSAQYPVSGTISKIGGGQWTIEVKTALPPATPSMFARVGDKIPNEIKYDIKQSIVSLSDTTTFFGKKKEEFVMGDIVTVYSMEPIRDLAHVVAMRVEPQGFAQVDAPIQLNGSSEIPVK